MAAVNLVPPDLSLPPAYHRPMPLEPLPVRIYAARRAAVGSLVDREENGANNRDEARHLGVGPRDGRKVVPGLGC